MLTFDHQILDGVPVVKIIEELYQTMNTQIAQELRSLLVTEVETKPAAKKRTLQHNAA